MNTQAQHAMLLQERLARERAAAEAAAAAQRAECDALRLQCVGLQREVGDLRAELSGSRVRLAPEVRASLSEPQPAARSSEQFACSKRVWAELTVYHDGGSPVSKVMWAKL